MGDNHADDGAAVEGENGGVPHVLPIDGESEAENAGYSAHQIEAIEKNNGNKSDLAHEEQQRNGVPVEDGGRDDMFVDCQDEIETSSVQTDEDNLQVVQDGESESGVKQPQLIHDVERSHDTHDNGSEEQEINTRGYEEERELVMSELSRLYYQVKACNEQQTNPDEYNGHLEIHPVTQNASNSRSISSLEMVNECSRFFENASKESLQNEERIKKLHLVLQSKDQEIDSLNVKLADMSRLNSESSLESGHVEEVVNRMLGSLSMIFHQEGLEGSLTEKITSMEKSLAFLVDKYLTFSSETEQLRRFLMEVGSNSSMIDEAETLSAACHLILESRKKEEILQSSISNLQDDRSKMVDELDEHRSLMENLSGEIHRLNTEVELEKSRYANTKEKLSMAVTKGKALIQQRDSLKQLLAEKTDELEKTALVAAEKTKELLEAVEKSSASMQELLAEKDLVLQNCREILFESMRSEDLPSEQITDQIRLLVNENFSMRSEFQQVADALSSLDFPESVASSELDSRIRWLVESLYHSKEEAAELHSEVAETKELAHLEITSLTVLFVAQTLEIYCLEAEGDQLREEYEEYERLRHEIVEAREALNNEIDQLKASRSADSQEKSGILLELENLRQVYEGAIEKERLRHDEEVNHHKALLSAESHEKSCLQLEFENLRQHYEGLVEKERLISLDNYKLLTWLLEESGLADYGQEETPSETADMKTLFDNCLEKIKENNKLSRPSQYDETFEELRSFIYVTYQGMSLYELIAEEDILNQEKLDLLSNELEKKNLELNALVNEKAAMQENLTHLEDRCAVLKDKLSMAVKKGKGLAQEKENLKNILNGKNSEIENFRSELQQSVSRYNELLDRIAKLTHEVQLIPVLQNELAFSKQHGDQIEQLLSESKSTLKSVLESIENLTIPGNLVFEEPIEKLRWISRYLYENEISKMEAEQELRKVTDEASLLAEKLSSMQAIIVSLEDAVFVAEDNQSVLLNEKEALVFSKAGLEKELREEKERSASHLSKLEMLSLSTRALEDDLSQARVDISRIINDRDAAVESRNLAEEKLQKLEEEFSQHVIRLSDAGRTIESLENALSEAQKNIAILNEQNSEVEFGRVDLGNEIKKLRIEAESNLSKLSESSNTIRSLEASLLDAENKIAELVQLKEGNEQEIAGLSSKLESCTEELARTLGSLENNSMDFSVILSHFQNFLKDKTLQSLIVQFFERHIERTKNIDSLLRDIADCFPEMDSDFQSSFALKDVFHTSTNPTGPVSSWSMDSFEDEIGVDDDGNILSHIEKVTERAFQERKMLADKFGNFSMDIDESYASLLRRLHSTRDGIRSLVNFTKVLNQNLKDVDTEKQKQEESIASIHSNNRTLSSACAEATERLKLNFSNSVSELRSLIELAELEGNKDLDIGAIGHQMPASFATSPIETAGKLLIAVTCNCDLIQLLKDALREMSEVTRDLQKRMEEAQHASDVASKERESYKNHISELEDDLEAQENLYCVQIDEYKEQINELRKREADLSTSLSKFQEMHDTILPASQLKAIMDKLNGIRVPIEYVNSDGDAYDSIDVRKLCYIVDSFSDSLHKANSLSQENKELKSVVDQQIPVIESLRKQVEREAENRVDTEEMNKSKTTPENSMRPPHAEIVQERGNSVASLPQSEISEMQGMGTVTTISAIPLVPSAAHVRTLRKGSSDHLTINIDSDIQQLVHDKDSDEYKGHVFKSLNTSGMIPRQGRAVADRIDGIWVSGSRALMNHPRGRLGLIAYTLLMHLWLLGTIL